MVCTHPRGGVISRFTTAWRQHGWQITFEGLTWRLLRLFNPIELLEKSQFKAILLNDLAMSTWSMIHIIESPDKTKRR